MSSPSFKARPHPWQLLSLSLSLSLNFVNLALFWWLGFTQSIVLWLLVVILTALVAPWKFRWLSCMHLVMSSNLQKWFSLAIAFKTLTPMASFMERIPWIPPSHYFCLIYPLSSLSFRSFAFFWSLSNSLGLSQRSL